MKHITLIGTFVALAMSFTGCADHRGHPSKAARGAISCRVPKPPQPDRPGEPACRIKVMRLHPPGFIESPFANGKLIDVRGLRSGTEVECPYTGRAFLVP